MQLSLQALFTNATDRKKTPGQETAEDGVASGAAFLSVLKTPEVPLSDEDVAAEGQDTETTATEPNHVDVPEPGAAPLNRERPVLSPPFHEADGPLEVGAAQVPVLPDQASEAASSATGRIKSTVPPLPPSPPGLTVAAEVARLPDVVQKPVPPAAFLETGSPVDEADASAEDHDLTLAGRRVDAFQNRDWRPAASEAQSRGADAPAGKRGVAAIIQAPELPTEESPLGSRSPSVSNSPNPNAIESSGSVVVDRPQTAVSETLSRRLETLVSGDEAASKEIGVVPMAALRSAPAVPTAPRQSEVATPMVASLSVPGQSDAPERTVAMPPDEPPVSSRPDDLGKPLLFDAPFQPPDRSSVEPTRHLRRHRDVEHHGHDTGPRASATSTAIAFPVVPASVKLVPGKDGTILRDVGDQQVYGDSELVSIEHGGRARGAAPEHVRQEQPSVRSVVTQIVQSVTRSQASNVIEVRLQPEELGRVRLTLSPSDSGMAVQIVADRAETLDLLRRNIDLLAEDLNRRGFSDLDFSFEGGSAPPDRDVEHLADGEEAPKQDDPLLVEVEPTTRNVVPHSGRLDIRL